MSDQNDDPGSPTEPQAEPAADATIGRESGRPDNTPELAKAKGQTPLSRVERRLREIEALLREKEAFQMGHVFCSFPAPYYESWKVEGNDVFALAVTYANRARAIRKKAEAKAKSK